MTSGKKRLLLVGWDSADWKIIHPMLDRGELPGLKTLVEGGVSGNLNTLEPQLSPMLWTSIATGKMAYHHGVRGFTEVHPTTGKILPVSAATRSCRTVWEMLGEHGLRSHVVGWFATQGEHDLNGKMVSNMFPHLTGVPREAKPEDWPAPMPGTYWPENLGAELDSLRVSPWEMTGDDVIRAFVPDAPQVDQTKDKRLHHLAEKLAEAYSIQSAATYLMETDPEWDFMAVYFRAIDEISHFIMPYHPPRMDGVPEADFQMYQHVVTAAYRVHDMMLQRLLHLAGPDTAVMLVSDHGFHSDHLRPKFTPRVPAGITVWHRPQGVIVANGPGMRQDELIRGARLLDITPTVLHFFGLPVGDDMEGRVLEEAFVEPRPIERIPTWETGDFPARTALPPAASDALLEQFVALGYIDEIATDPNEAAAETHRENDWNLARACLYGGKYEQALPLLENCHAARPDRADYSQLLAKTQLELGLLAEAEQTLHLCLQSLGDTDAARLLMGSIETQRGNHAQALAHLDFVRAKNPENVQILHSLSETLLALRRWSDAEQCARQMLRLDPGGAQGHLILARCHLHQGDFPAAAEAALDAIGLQYGHPRGHFLLGAALVGMEDWPAAGQALRNHLKLNPNNSVALRYLAQVHRAMDEPSVAAELETQARLLRITRLASREKRVATIRQQATGREKPLPRPEPASPVAPMTFTVVSGLPRSGTSLMMQILRAGGMDLMHDGIRTADDDNREGYWEWEAIKSLAKNPRIIEQADGKVIKIVSALLTNLPPVHRYRIVFMRRPIDEVIDSQWKMLANRNVAPKSDRAHLAKTQTEHVEKLLESLRRSPRVELLEIDFPTLVQHPEGELLRLQSFLGDELQGDIASLTAAVRPELYRNRDPRPGID
ncbi:MAG: alkaline phosphatase family protein [Verrucomicrobiota bacterium]